MKAEKCSLIVEGCPVFYRLAGPEDGRAVIFIHGATGDSRLFLAQIKGLGERFRVIAVDLPGHGSSQQNGDLTIEIYRDSVIALIRHLELEQVTLAGHSMGGGVIFEVFSAVPELVRSMIFISSAHRLPVNPMVFELIENNFNGFCEMAVKLSYSPDADEAILGLGVEEMRKVGPIISKTDFGICSRFDYTGQAAALSKPVLAITTEEDRMVPMKLVRQFVETVPGAKLTVLNAKGHMPHIEAAQQLNEEIARFLDSCS